ncbi:ubiquitin family protein [Saccharothrix stipae]
MARLITPLSWRQQTGGKTTFEVADGPLDHLLVGFAERFPAVRGRLIDGNGEVHRYFKVFVDDEVVRYDDFALISTRPATVVLIVPPMAGG